MMDPETRRGCGFLQCQFPQTSGMHGTGPSGRRFFWEPGGVNMTGFHPDVLTAEHCEDCRTQSSGSVCAAVFADFAVSSFSPSTFAVSPLTCPDPSLPFTVSFPSSIQSPPESGPSCVY